MHEHPVTHSQLAVPNGDFELGTLRHWTVIGDLWRINDLHHDIAQPTATIAGHYFATSHDDAIQSEALYYGGPTSVVYYRNTRAGTLISEPFLITRDFLTVWVSGSPTTMNCQLGVDLDFDERPELLVDDTRESVLWRQTSIDLSAYRGRMARLVAHVSNFAVTYPAGWFSFDNVRLTDSLPPVCTVSDTMRMADAQTGEISVTFTNHSQTPAVYHAEVQVTDHFTQPLISSTLSGTLDGGETREVKVQLSAGSCHRYRAQVTTFDADGRLASEKHQYYLVDSQLGRRQHRYLDDAWLFARVPGDAPFSVTQTLPWDNVTLPSTLHTDAATPRVAFRKTFTAPVTTDRHVRLRFPALRNTAQIYLNGEKLGEVLASYPVTIDVTRAIRSAQANELVVVLHNGAGLDYFEIYMPDSVMLADHVSLDMTDALTITDNYVVTSFRDKTVTAHVTVTNDGATPRTATLGLTVIDPRAGTVAVTLPTQTITLQPGETHTYTLTAPWDDPRLWFPQSPNLYKMEAVLSHDQQSIDTLDTRFGFRESWFEGKDFYFNGRRFVVICQWMHENFASPEDWWQIIRSKKAFGINCMRGPNAAQTEITDEEGIFVYPEGAMGVGTTAWRDPRTFVSAQTAWEHLVYEYRNAPSMLLYSITNEQTHTGMNVVNPDAVELLGQIGKRVAELDPTRPIFFNGDLDLSNQSPLISYHYEHDLGSTPLIPNDLDWMTAGASIDNLNDHLLWDGVKPLFGSEISWGDTINFPHTFASVTGEDAYYKANELSGWRLYHREMLDWLRYRGIMGYHTWFYGYRQSPVAAFLPEYFRTFTGGQMGKSPLVLMNDSLEDSRFNIVWQLAGQDIACTGTIRDIALAAGIHDARTLAIPLPSVEQTSTATLTVKLVTEGTVIDTFSRDWTIYPSAPLTITPAGTVGLYGGTAEFIQALGALGVHPESVVSLTELPKIDKLLIAPQALQSAPTGATREALLHFVAGGGHIVVLEQSVDPNFLAVDLALTDRRETSAFPLAQEQPALRGIQPNDLRFWRGDHLVVQRNFQKPTRGNFRVLAECNGVDGLTYTPLVEVGYGQGSVLFCQLLVGEKLTVEPAAGHLLKRLLESTPVPLQTGRVGMLVGGALKTLYRQLGVQADDLSVVAPELSKYATLLLDGKRICTRCRSS